MHVEVRILPRAELAETSRPQGTLSFLTASAVKKYAEMDFRKNSGTSSLPYKRQVPTSPFVSLSFS